MSERALNPLSSPQVSNLKVCFGPVSEGPLFPGEVSPEGTVLNAGVGNQTAQILFGKHQLLTGWCPRAVSTGCRCPASTKPELQGPVAPSPGFWGGGRQQEAAFPRVSVSSFLTVRTHWGPPLSRTSYSSSLESCWQEQRPFGEAAGNITHIFLGRQGNHVFVFF